MKHEDFIKNIESLYGQYSPAQVKVASMWLKQYRKDLNILFAEILKGFSWQYKVPPGIKEFEDASDRIRKKDIALLGQPKQFEPLKLDEPRMNNELAEKMFNEMRTVLNAKKSPTQPVNHSERLATLKKQAEELRKTG